MNDPVFNESGYSTEAPVDELPPPEDNDVLEVCIMTFFGLLGTSLGINGFFVVRKNSILKGIIEHYAFMDLLNMTLINSCHLLWAVPCVIWQANEWCPFLDYVFSGIAFTSVSIGFPPKIFLSLNRFFALAFDGSYYKYYERTYSVQYFIMAAYPLATAIAYAIPGCGVIFISWQQNFFMPEGDCGLEIMYYTQVLASWIYLPINTFLDSCIFYLMRRRIRAFREIQGNPSSRQRAEQLRKEMRLAAQMILNLLCGIFLNVSLSVGESYIASAFEAFILYTALWQLCMTINSATYVTLLRERKPKEVSGPATVSNISTSSPRGLLSNALNKAR